MSQPFDQNVIAVIWDFDKTLINGYMQDPIFKTYGVDSGEFWKEVTALEKQYKAQSGHLRINRDTIYLNHFLTCVAQGIFPGLNNELLFELGKQLEFYPGMPGFIRSTKALIGDNPRFKTYNIAVEHYIVSTGMAEMIRGSAIAPDVDGIWGCEFIEEPIRSKLRPQAAHLETAAAAAGEPVKQISQIGYAIDNTSKTRAIFEINKGANINEEIDVNSSMSRHLRRVPFEHMIYIADGPSDVPAFSIVKQNGGGAFAVYPKGKLREFQQVEQLRRDDRIDMYGMADYTEDSTTHMWLVAKITQIAEAMCVKKEEIIRRSISNPPGHITE